MSMRHKKFIERNERYDMVQWKFKLLTFAGKITKVLC